jgi:hypothetical protein
MKLSPPDVVNFPFSFSGKPQKKSLLKRFKNEIPTFGFILTKTTLLLVNKLYFAPSTGNLQQQQQQLLD